MNDLTFKSPVNETEIEDIASVLGVPGLDVTENSNTIIEWEFEIEARETGIKSMFPVVRKVKSFIEWEAYTDEVTEDQKTTLINSGAVVGKSYITGSISVDTSLVQWKIDASDFTPTISGQVFPETVRIDFTNKVIEVE